RGDQLPRHPAHRHRAVPRRALMVPRRKSIPVNVGGVVIGGAAPIAVQTMTKTDTRDVKATLRQIHELKDAGCEVVRPAVPDREAAEALREIVKGSPLPVIADIHYDHTLALLAIEAGVHCLRLNPGNIPDRDKVAKVGTAAKERQIPFRIGVNAGSLPEEVHKSLREQHHIAREEDRVAHENLKTRALRNERPTLVACPTCGRVEYDMRPTVKAVQAYIAKLQMPLTVAVMGRVVNGPAEARHADIGVTGGRGKGVIFKKGKHYKTVPQEDLLPVLLGEIDEVAAEMGAEPVKV